MDITNILKRNVQLYKYSPENRNHITLFLLHTEVLFDHDDVIRVGRTWPTWIKGGERCLNVGPTFLHVLARKTSHASSALNLSARGRFPGFLKKNYKNTPTLAKQLWPSTLCTSCHQIRRFIWLGEDFES